MFLLTSAGVCIFHTLGSRLLAGERVVGTPTSVRQSFQVPRGESKGGGHIPAVNHEQVAANWASRGLSCDLWTDPPGQRWEDFRHATDELVIIL